MNAETDDIDFTKLEKELAAAVEADKKYSRENAAKFRAVEQRVGSYEEFRNIVLASSLQPLERKDIDGTSKRHQPLNPVCSSSKNDMSLPQEENIVEVDDPTSGKTESVTSFVKKWKTSLRTSLKRYQYLIKLDSLNAGKILASELVGDLIGEIIMALNECFSSVYTAKILCILKNLSKSKRFMLSLQFLSKTEKNAANELFEKLTENAEEEQTELLNELKLRYLG
ncbi:coiled-coil domain-containing protein 103-like [Rhopilema esculentum]|uniref:coiled-coil domain-containing protein 103-like n=1 Tax=Rhopilema esculentum TaxID=499914 RepID=UPI0031D660B8|eukprot:gene1540-15989_t